MTSFEIKISPKRSRSSTEESDEDDVPVLFLAPFQKPPTVSFQDVVLGTVAEKKLIIKNSRNCVQVKFNKLPAAEHNITFSTTELTLTPKEDVVVTLCWTPSQLGSWRETVHVNYSSNTRLDLPLHILFNSVPPVKKRKQLGKPLRLQLSKTVKSTTKVASPKKNVLNFNQQHILSSGKRRRIPNKENSSPLSRKNKKTISKSPIIKHDKPATVVGDFFERLDSFTFSPLTNNRSNVQANSLGTTVKSNNKIHVETTPLRRGTFLASDVKSSSNIDKLEDRFISLNGRDLPPCTAVPSPLRRTTYDVDSESSVIHGEDFKPCDRKQLPPCTVPPSPWRRTTYVKPSLACLKDEENFYRVMDKQLPPCNNEPSPLRRTTFTTSHEPSFLSDYEDNCNFFKKPSSPLKENFLVSSQSKNSEDCSVLQDLEFDLLKEKLNSITPLSKRLTCSYTKSSFECVVEKMCYSSKKNKQTTFYADKNTSAKGKASSSSGSEKLSSIDSLDENDYVRSKGMQIGTLRDNGNSVHKPLDFHDSFVQNPLKQKKIVFNEVDEHAFLLDHRNGAQSRLLSDFLVDVSQAYDHVAEDSEINIRRCSNETYIKSPDSSFIASVLQTSPLAQDEICQSSACWSEEKYIKCSIDKSIQSNESAKDVIEAGMWFEPYNQNSSQLSEIHPIDSSSRRESNARVTKSAIKPTSVNRKSSIRQSARASVGPAVSTPITKGALKDFQLMRPPIGRPPKGGSRSLSAKKSSLSNISAKRAREAMKTLTNKLLTSTPIKSIVSPAREFHDPDDFIYNLANPDPFCPSTTMDPFVMSQVYHSDEWLDRQERNFVKWLNDLLTPPDDLDSNAEPPKVDIANMWQQSCRKAASTPAPSIEVVTLRVLTHGRLDALRKAAAMLFRSAKMAPVLAKVVGHVDKGLIMIRKDRQIHLDVGLKSVVMGLLLCYNPLWLRIGLETVFGLKLDLHSNSDVEGLGTFIATRVLEDPYIAKTYSHPSVPQMRLPGYEDAIKKFVLKKFLFLVYFLDKAKTQRLIGHDPCLFCKNAEYKESSEILVTFARELVSGKLITKQLGTLGYSVTHKQTFLNEFDFAVTHLGSDLRDGIRLTRVMEIILRNNTLQAKLRVPPISLLQKIHNVKIALKALEGTGYVLEGDITAKDITNSHREKTLSLLWQIVHKFQAPRFKMAATKIQIWWRALPTLIQRNILNRKRRVRDLAATKIQALWRGYYARKNFTKIRELAKEAAVKHKAACKIQSWYRACYRKQLLVKQTWAVIKIQTYFRKYLIKKQIQHESDTLIQESSVLKIQAFYRGYLVRKQIRTEITAATRIQAAYRSYILRKQKKIQTVCATRIQAVYRGYHQRQEYLRKKTATIVIQTRIRGFLCRKHLAQQRQLAAVKAIQLWYRRYRAQRWLNQLVDYVQSEMITRRSTKLAATVKIQKYVRGWAARKLVGKLKRDISRMRAKERNAAVKIQSAYRGYLVRRQLQVEKKSTIIIQAVYRGYLQRQRLKLATTSAIRIQAAYRGYFVRIQQDKLRKAVIVIQAHVRGYLCRQHLIQQRHKAAVSLIETWWKRRRAHQRLNQLINFIEEKNKKKRAAKLRATIVIQKYFRGFVARKHVNFIRHEIYVNNNAALSIQKAFRGYLVRKQLRVESNAATIIQAVYRGYLQRQRLKLETTCATRIQAAYRGHIVRIHQAKLKRAAVVIQAHIRGHLCRELLAQQRRLAAVRVIENWWKHQRACQRLNELVDMVEEDIKRKRVTKLMATIVLQKYVRGYMARKHVNYVKYVMNLQQNSALIIQKVFRGYVVRKELRVKSKAATIIQAVYRGHMQRQRLKLETTCATRIQAAYRGYLVRTHQAKLKRAAIVIQAHIRGHLCRERLAQQRCLAAVRVIENWWKHQRACQRLNQLVDMVEEDIKRKRVTKLMATIVLQKYVRGYMARKHFNYLKYVINLQQNSALIIQKVFRGYMVRKEFCVKSKAATIIQAVYRGYMQRQRLKLETTCATRIQAAYRGHIVRTHQARLKGAAVVIQAHIRGHLCRERLAQQRRLAAVGVIENWWKHQRACQRLNELVDMVEEDIKRKRVTKLMATIVLQKYVRGYMARKHFNYMKYVINLQQNSALIIQKVFRGYMVRKELCVKSKAATIIQAVYRGYMQRQRLKLETTCATRIQAAYRGHLVRTQLAKLKRAAVVIQAHMRGHLCRERLAQQRCQAAIRVIENWWKHQRARQHLNQLVDMVEEDIKKRRAVKLMATIVIQKYIRGYMTRKHANYMQYVRNLHQNSALIIQKVFRGYRVRKQLQVENKAAVLIQAVCRRYSLRQRLKLETRCAIRIQAAYRGHLMRVQQAKLRKAAIVLQAHVRGYLCREHLAQQRCLAAVTQNETWWKHQRALQRLNQLVVEVEMRKEHAAKLKATIVIQKYFRGYVSRKNVNSMKRDIALQTSAAVMVQSVFRGYLLRKHLREQNESETSIESAYRGYLQRQRLKLETSCATRIQAAYRGHLVRVQQAKLRKAAIVIQAHVRGYFCREHLAQQRRLAAVAKIETWWKRQRARQRLNQLVKVEKRKKHAAKLKATIVIQKYFRGFVARKHVSCMKYRIAAKVSMERSAAVKIQACWRGYLERKKSKCEKVASIRGKLMSMSLGSAQAETLLHRYTRSLHILTETSEVVSMGHLLTAYTTLDTVTQLSPILCERFVADDLIEISFDYLENFNRSVPHMEATELILHIFCNLVRYSPTIEAVYQDGKCLPVVLRLMKTYTGKLSLIFNLCCTLLWLFAQQTEKAKAITNNSTVQTQLIKLYSEKLRLAAIKTRKHSQTEEHKLPSVHPHWTQTRDMKPRAFENQFHAITTLMKSLKLKVNN